MGFLVPPKAKEPFVVAGRLASFIDTWKVLTGDLWILSAIEGYQIPFVGIPTQLQIPQEGMFSRLYYRRRSRTCATIPQSGDATGFISTLFLVPKRNGQMRPVINLKRLNQ